MVRQRLEPRPEAPRRIIDEGRHQAVELQQDLLGDVLGIGLLESPAAAPVEDLGPVAGDEIAPGGLVLRVVAETGQQRDVGLGRMILSHAARLRVRPDARPTPGESEHANAEPNSEEAKKEEFEEDYTDFPHVWGQSPSTTANQTRSYVVHSSPNALSSEWPQYTACRNSLVILALQIQRKSAGDLRKA